MKIILTAVGSHGDIRPMVALGKRLSGMGHEIILCASANHENFVRSCGLTYHEAGLNCDTYVFKRQEETRNRLKWLSCTASFTRMELGHVLEHVLPIAADADMIVSAGYNFAARTIAEYYGIPHRHIMHMPQALKSSSHAVMGIGGVYPEPLNDLAWAINDLIYDGMMLKMLNASRRKLGLTKVLNAWDYLTGDMIVASDPMLATVPDDVETPYVQTGYLHLHEDKPLPAEVQSFIDAGPPPIYFGVGSMPNLMRNQLEKLFIGITEKLGQRLIIASGWGNIGDDMNLKNTMFVQSVSHEKLFPQMAMVIHHGGSGTLHTAARAGVPQIIIPHVMDQFYWGERVYRLGLGPKAENAMSVSGQKLLIKVKKVLKTPLYREHAQQLAQDLAPLDGVQLTANHVSNIAENGHYTVTRKKQRTHTA